MFSNKISRIIKFFFYISFCSLFSFLVSVSFLGSQEAGGTLHQIGLAIKRLQS